MLVKWENDPTITPRSANQAALDTILATAGSAVQERFATLITEQAAADHDARTEQLLRREDHYIKSPIDGKLMVPVEEGIFLAGPNNTPTWEEAFVIDVYPTTNADYARFVQATGHRPPKHCELARCNRLCRMGRQSPPDQSAVGEGSPRCKGAHVPLG
jgi:formylglycine-generating enzyme required for sulfatase activity